jgi:hypothetical protein
VREAVAPDGRRWRVARRWTRRRIRWRRLRQRREDEGRWWEVLDVLDVFGLVEVHPVLAAVAAVVLLAVLLGLATLFLVPLLLALVDAVVLVALVAAGGLARTLLGRPWEVEARSDGPPEEALVWRVRGWAESGRAVEQVAHRLEAGTHPSPDLAERG